MNSFEKHRSANMKEERHVYGPPLMSRCCKRVVVRNDVDNGDQTCTESIALKTVENQRFLKTEATPRQQSSCHTSYRGAPCQLARSTLLPFFYLNANANAGIPEPCSEGGRPETKQQSCTSVHSTDQYYSTHTDAEVKIMDSDVEVSPAFSFTQETPDVTNGVIQKEAETPLNLSRSPEPEIPIQGLEGSDPKPGLVENDVLLQSPRKKPSEQSNPDTPVKLRSDNHASRSQAALTSASKDPLAFSGIKNKRKTQTTEALYIKFESSMSKKVTTTTTLVKDTRRPFGNKVRQDRPKQLASSGELQRAAVCPWDKYDNRGVMDTARFTRVSRCGEGHNESLESRQKQQGSSETFLEFAAAKEPRHQTRAVRVNQGQVLRSAESDHRYSPVKEVLTSSCKSEDFGHVSRRISLSEVVTSDTSTLECPSLDLQKSGDLESDPATDVHYPASLSMSESSTNSPIPAKERATRPIDMTIKKDAIDKPSPLKRLDSPKKVLSNLVEKNEELEQSLPSAVANDLKENDEDEEKSSEITKISLLPKATLSCTSEKSPVNGINPEKKEFRALKDNTLQKKVIPKVKPKAVTKKPAAVKGKSKSTEDARGRPSGSLVASGRTTQHSSSVARKKSVAGLKSLFRSPDGKRKKRSVKKASNSKSNSEADDPKPEKPRKQKSNDKMGEKKKKKKKHKPKPAAEEVSQTLKSAKMPMLSRSRSNDSNKTTQTVSVSSLTTKLLDTATSETQLSPAGHSKREKDSKSSSLRDKRAASEESNLCADREQVVKQRDVKSKSHMASSAENLSLSPVPGKAVRSAECMPTFAVTAAKPAAKTIQLTAQPAAAGAATAAGAVTAKQKRQEKDLQQAELGWNSSMLSTEEKAAIEKARQSQKRQMVRYYIVKPRPKKTEREVGASKLKRSVKADGDGACTSGEMDAKQDGVQPEKLRTGPGKSVQFSDSIEDLEATKDELISERLLHKPESDAVLHIPAPTKPITEIKPSIKTTEPETTVTNKASMQKKEEIRPPATPPRRKRPIWLKKANKDKPEGVPKSNSAEKNIQGTAAAKHAQSSENSGKPASRFNIHLLYPVKPTIGSPKLSNISLSDKRKVAYNTWINSIFLAAPLNKATKKLIAKTGSPVDIKEITEGSSVDAADHFRAMRGIHESGVRAAKSVPSLGPQRSAVADLVGGGKKMKLMDEGKKIKRLESPSPRSISSQEASDDLGLRDPSLSSSTCSKVDVNAGAKKAGLKKHKLGKSRSPRHLPKWHIVEAQDTRQGPELAEGPYYGDVVEFNVLNMGWSWVMQTVVNRLPFLNPRQDPSTTIVSRPVPVNLQLEDKPSNPKK